MKAHRSVALEARGQARAASASRASAYASSPRGPTSPTRSAASGRRSSGAGRTRARTGSRSTMTRTTTRRPLLNAISPARCVGTARRAGRSRTSRCIKDADGRELLGPSTWQRRWTPMPTCSRGTRKRQWNDLLGCLLSTLRQACPLAPRSSRRTEDSLAVRANFPRGCRSQSAGGSAGRSIGGTSGGISPCMAASQGRERAERTTIQPGGEKPSNRCAS
jgi:hypothetical protein